MTRRVHLDVVLAEIEGAGGVIDRIEHRKHWVVYWSMGERKLIYVTPTTSRSTRGLRNAASDIRRYARMA
jgi:hypothetical protein